MTRAMSGAYKTQARTNVAEDSRAGLGPYPSRTLAPVDKPASGSWIRQTLRLALSAAHASYSIEGIHCKEIERRVEGITHNKGRNLSQR